MAAARRSIALVTASFALSSNFFAGAACTLLTSLDGLSDAPEPGPGLIDAGNESAAPGDATPDTDGAGDAGESIASRYRSAVLTDRPISYFRFEETSGAVAKDEVGANDGAYKNAPTLGVRGAFAGSLAIRFQSSTKSHVLVASDAFRFPGRASFSVEVWVEPRLFDDYQWIASTEKDYGPRTGWSIFSKADARGFYELWRPPPDGGSGIIRFVATSKPLVTGRFQHLVMTFDGTVLATYIDGSPTGSQTDTSEAPEGGGLVFGCRGAVALASCLDGWALDEAALYDHPLSGARVKAHFDASQ